MAERKTPAKRKTPLAKRTAKKKQQQPKIKAFADMTQEEINSMRDFEIAMVRMHAATLYKTPEHLARDCMSYFQWSDANPLMEERIASDGGSPVHVKVAKARPYTLAGLCLHLGISRETWINWREQRSDLSEVIRAVDDAIYRQKFDGAGAGLFNANIIARDLGLVDKSEGKIDQSVNVSVKQYRAPDD